MKKLKLKRILLLFSMILALVGCFIVNGVNVKASDDLIFSVDNVGNSLKSNIVYTEYSGYLDKVVCVTSSSSICFLNYKTLEYSEEIPIENIPPDVRQWQCTLVGKYLIVVYITSNSSNRLFLKIDLDNYNCGSFDSGINKSSDYMYPSIHSKNDTEFYFSFYTYNYSSGDDLYLRVYNVETMKIVNNITSKGRCYYLSYANDDIVSFNKYEDYSGDVYDVNNKTKLGSNKSYCAKGYKFENYIFYVPTLCSSNSNSRYFSFYNLSNNTSTVTNSLTIKESNSSSVYCYASFCVDNCIYLIPRVKSGYIEKFTINSFSLEGDRNIFTSVDTPLSYQDILEKYTASDKYGRSLITSVKADSYYNSFSTPGNYSGTVTVSDGYCHEDFGITIVVSKGGGEEEKKESTKSALSWDTNLMIQSFGGIAVFLIIGLLVVSLIKKILR